MVTGDNDYEVRVFKYDTDDQQATPLLRALHDQLCRPGDYGLHSTGMPVCVRAESIVRRAAADGVAVVPGPKRCASASGPDAQHG